VTLLTDDVRALLGQQRVYVAPEPIGAAAFRYFSIATGDDNSLYHDATYAREAGLFGVTAPPTLICETNQYANLPMEPGGYAGHSWDIDLPGTRQVRGGNSYTFHRRVRPEDVIVASWEISGIEEKTTRSGAAMLIISSRATYTDQHAELLAVNDETIIFVELERP
jgi:hypothetical protein